MMHLKVSWKMTWSCVCCWIAPYTYLILLGQDCCCVGRVALTAFLLLKDFLFFSFNSEVLQLICTISWTKRDHNSQRDDTVLVVNSETKAPEHFSKSCLPCSFWARLCRWWMHAGMEAQGDTGSPVEEEAPEERGGNEATVLWRSGALRDGDQGEAAEAAGTKGSQLSSHLQEKNNRNINYPPCKHKWRIGWSVQGYLSSREYICKNSVTSAGSCTFI